MATTEIEWASRVWNPTTGCDRISKGCDDCYALTFAARLKGMGQEKYQRDGDPRTSGPGFGLTLHPQVLEHPLAWRKPARIFVDSMSDLFHREVPDTFIGEVFDVIARAQRHDFLVLTKRAKRMARTLERLWRLPRAEVPEVLARDVVFVADARDVPIDGAEPRGHPVVLPNVWTGVSVEDAIAERRLRYLADTPSALRWVSAEPLVGPPSDRLPELLAAADVRWVVVGGESGARARPLELAWVRAWRDAARDAGAAVFVKQLGAVWARYNGGPAKGGNPDLWPEDLRIREDPATPREATCTDSPAGRS